jgi:hypothetical protein
MKKICEWLCPQKKKTDSPYDVHEETFEMDDNNEDAGGQDKLSDSTSRESDRM